jgi:hypothetical protein
MFSVKRFILHDHARCQSSNHYLCVVYGLLTTLAVGSSGRRETHSRMDLMTPLFRVVEYLCREPFRALSWFLPFLIGELCLV